MRKKATSIMKDRRTPFFLLISLCAVACVIFQPYFTARKQVAIIEKPDKPLASTPRTCDVNSHTPRRIVSDKINVDANIIPVTTDQKGNMAVPEKPDEVAWYSLGAAPGDKGNAVLAGHLDDVRGQPAIFYHLHDIAAGDEITIYDSCDRPQKFKVIDTQIYTVDRAPFEQIFGKSDGKNLNLITCEGDWDKQSQNYNQRLVVYTQMVE